MKTEKFVSAIITGLAAALIVIGLILTRLSVDLHTWPPQPKTTPLMAMEEEFIEVFEEASDHMAAPVPQAASPAAKPAPKPLPAKADNPPLRTTQPNSSVLGANDKAPSSTPFDKPKRESEESNPQTRQSVMDAFRTSATPDKDTEGPSKGTGNGAAGRKEGSEEAVSGTGTGTVDGGWMMPNFAKVPSTCTGSVKLEAVIGPDGRVIKVYLTGGKAPASADTKLVARCMAEVRRHVFSRRDSNAPDNAKARITYVFR